MAKSVGQPYFVTLSVDERYRDSIIAGNEEEAKLKMLEEILCSDRTLRMLSALYPEISQKLVEHMVVEDKSSVYKNAIEAITALNNSASEIIAKSEKIPADDYIKLDNAAYAIRNKLNATPSRTKNKDAERLLRQCNDLLYVVKTYYTLPLTSEE